MPKRIDGKKTSILVSLAVSLSLVSLSGLMTGALAQTYTDAQGRSITKDEYEAGQLVNEASQLLNQNKNADALFRLESAVRIAPNMPDAHYNYGIALAKMGQTDEAVRQYQDATRLNPGMAFAWMNLGASYQMLGKIEEAVQAYTEFVTRFPSNPEAGKVKSLIVGLNKELGRQTNLPSPRPTQPQQAQQPPQNNFQPINNNPPQGNNFVPINNPPQNNFVPINDGSQGFAAPQKPKTDWTKGSQGGGSTPPAQPGLSGWQGGDDSSGGSGAPGGSMGGSSNRPYGGSSSGSGSVGLSPLQGGDSGSSGDSQGNFQPIGKSGSQGGGFQPIGNVKTQGSGFQPIGGGGSQSNFQPIGGGSQGNFQPIGNGGSQGNFQPIANAGTSGGQNQPSGDLNRFAPPDEPPAQGYQQPPQKQRPPQAVQRPNQPPANQPLSNRPQQAANVPNNQQQRPPQGQPQQPQGGRPQGTPNPQGGGGSAAANYLADVGGARLGKWPADRMPLRVCIVPAANVKGYQPAFDQCLIKCFQDWGNSSGGKVSFKGVSDQQAADIVCTWTSDTSKFMNSAEAGETTVYGSQKGIQHVTMQILTVPHPMSPSIPLTENRLRWICLHEIGHALGLGGHTKNPQDIMFFTTPMADIWKELTARDCNTLQALYAR